jgi:2-dehydro-3-deoxyphosphooctonate aldolase (KDO 8-P synthase)
LSLKPQLKWIAGPCVIESKEICKEVLEFCLSQAEKFNLDYTFKASYDKANRTHVDSFRGPGLEKGLRVLEDLKKEYNVSLLTDVHDVGQVSKAAEVVDVIQIPAFLCRQTDLLVAAGKTQKIINIKKGQFLDPQNMKYAVQKVRSSNPKAEVWITERGACFGNQQLVVDFCGVKDLLDLGETVILDVTHSVQRPGGGQDKTGGAKQYISTLGRAGVAVGVQGIFTEVHPDPDIALSDGANSLSFKEVTENFLQWGPLWKSA